VNAVEPGLLAPPSFNIGGNQYVGALFSDGATYVLPPGAIAGITSRRAQPGDTITLYGVGFGPVTPNTPAGQIVQQNNALTLPFNLSFGSTNASVTYAGLAPSAVGLYQFNVTVPSVPSSDLTPLSFTLNGAKGSQTLYIAVQNPNASVTVSSLTLSPSSVAGGGTVQGSVTLSAPAPAGGVVVALSSSSASATLPATVTVPAGNVSTSFTIATSAVSSNQTATITASYAGSSAQATLTITGGGFPQFKSALMISTPLNAPIPVGVTVLPGIGGGYGCLLQAGVSDPTPLVGIANFSTFAVSGLSFTCTGIDVTASKMFDKLGNMAQITSGSLTVTLTPQVVSTSGTAAGTLNLVSTLGTISGSFSGTYTAQ
jgi:hypothetical protein